MTVNGRTMGENCRGHESEDRDVIRPFDNPLVKDAGFIVLKGNLFDSAIMKTSVISKEFRDRYLSNPKSPNAFEGRAIVFEGPEDYHHRIDDPSLNIDENCMLFIRGTGPIGYPGGAEVVNMQPPAALIKRGIHSLPCIGDGRQSGTSGSPSILNASPEAAAGGGLALIQTGDRVRIDLNKGEANILISDEELAKAPRRAGGARRLPDPARARRPGRRSSAAWSTSSRRAWCSSRRSNTSTSPRSWASRATTTEAPRLIKRKAGRERPAFSIAQARQSPDGSETAHGQDQRRVAPRPPDAEERHARSAHRLAPGPCEELRLPGDRRQAERGNGAARDQDPAPPQGLSRVRVS